MCAETFFMKVLYINNYISNCIIYIIHFYLFRDEVWTVVIINNQTSNLQVITKVSPISTNYNLWILLSMTCPLPVSYTHLDVYKRQK